MPIHLSPLTIKDQARLNQALASTGIGGKTSLSTWSFPPHYIWKDLFTFSWTDIDGWLCLFAEYSDGIFMPLPPVRPCSDIGSSSGSSLKNVLRQVMAYMEIRNRRSHVTRIENIPAALKEELQEWGYTLTPKDSDYLYRTADLIHLKGNLYKSQRAACNRFIRAHRIRIAPYQNTDREECLALFSRWVHQKENIPISRLGPNEDVARMMLRDSANAHRVTLQEHRELGLTGRIVRVDEAVKAYTFGFPQSSEVFCVLLEIADRSVYGLAQYLFREFCREFQAYPLINTMDDSGLPALARTKLSYHPCQLVPNYIAQPS